MEYAAILVAPEAVDGWLKRSNRPLAAVSAEEWKEFFDRHIAALKQSTTGSGWGVSNGGRERELKEQVEKLQEEVERLTKAEEELAKLREEKEALEAELKALKTGQEQKAIPDRRCWFLNPTPGKHPIPELPAGIPPKRPPAKFKVSEKRWERKGLVLAIMAMTGWSMRMSIAETIATLRGLSPRSGSLRKLFDMMKAEGLTWGQVAQLAGRSVAVIGLTDKGKELARFMGVEPVESEWETLQREHGGDRQEGHALAVVTFAHHARRFGFQTEVCPPNPSPEVRGFSPDIALSAEGRTWYVEVENGSGDEERRFRKWKNMEKAVGYVAIASSTSEMLHRMVREAKGAGVKCGAGADISALSGNTTDPFWPVLWGV